MADRKKSWREIDNAKNKSTHISKDERAIPKRQKAAAKSAYSKYKSELDKLFDTGEATGTVQHLVKTKSTKGGSSERQTLLKKIRKEDSLIEITKLVTLFSSKYDFPEDEELLIYVIEHPDESIALKGLKILAEIARLRPLKHKKLMPELLKTIELTAMDDDLRELAVTMRKSLM